MKKRLPPLPAPSRGVLTEIAKELGVTRQAVSKRFHRGDSRILLHIARVEKARARARKAELEKYVRALQ